MNEALIKALDKTVCRTAVRAWSAMRSAPPRSPYTQEFTAERFPTVMVLRPGGMGDLALTLPLLRVLKNLGMRVQLVANRRNSELAYLLKDLDIVDELLFFENAFSIVNQHRGKVACIIDTEQYFYTSALLARALAPQLLVGFDTNERRGLYDLLAAYTQDMYEAHTFLHLLKPLNVPISFHPADLLLPALPLPERLTGLSDKMLVFAPHATCTEKMLPRETIKKTIQQLSERYTSIVAIGGHAAYALSDHCAAELPHFTNLCGQLTVAESVALLQRATAFFGVDSGSAHLAVLAGVSRSIVAFGPTVPAKWALRGKTIPIVGEAPCRPCGYGRFAQIPECPFGVQCMKGITPQQVVELL